MENYETSELGIASFLFTEGINIKEVKTDIPARFVFIFNLSPKAGFQVEDDWWGGKLSIDPRKYFEGIKQIKNIIFTTRQRLDKIV